MKKIFSTLLMVLLALPGVFALESGESTKGHEFYFSFIKSQKMNKGSEEKLEKKTILYISAERAGVIKFTDATGTVKTANFPAGSSSIALATISKDGAVSGVYPDCYTDVNNAVANKGYKVEVFESDGVTTQDVSLYAALIGGGTGDAANLYPYTALGNQYYVVSRSNNPSGKYGFSEALIVATEDNTEIEIYPTTVLDNQSASAEINKVTVTLNAGQTYQIRALQAEGDLTGTLIRTKDDAANRCKRIAVFSGTSHANPGDYEYEQLMPAHLWGNEYLVAPTADNCIPVVRIVASKPCTEVTINGTHVATLNQTEFYEYVDDNSQGAYIETSKPVEVAEYTYKRKDGSETNDASIVVLAPVKQMLDAIVFTPSENSYDGLNHRVTIMSPTDKTNDVKLAQLGGSEVPLSWTQFSVNPKYSYATAEIGNNAYSINASSRCFNAIVYGYKSDKSEYSYLAGSAAVTTELDISIDNNDTEDLDIGTDINSINQAPCIPMHADLKLENVANTSVISSVQWTIYQAAMSVSGSTVGYSIKNPTPVQDNVISAPASTFNSKLADEVVPGFYKLEMTVSASGNLNQADDEYSKCFITQGGGGGSSTQKIEAWFFVKDDNAGADLTKTVCYGIAELNPTQLELGSYWDRFGFADGDLPNQPKNHYEWYSVVGNDTTLLTEAFEPQGLATGSLEAGSENSYVRVVYNDQNHCVKYTDKMKIYVPSLVETDMKVSGDGKLNDEMTEIKFCNDGSGNEVTVNMTKTYQPDNAEPSYSQRVETWSLTKDGADITSAVSGNIYSYKPQNTEDIVYNVTVKDGFGNECYSADKTVRVVATPKFETSLMAHDYVKNIDGNPITLRMTGGELDLTATNSPASSTVYTYRWFRKNTATAMDSTDISNGRYDEGVKSLGVVESKGR
nr:IgGFc-binding protein [Paludibacteraceae bacterium]